MSARPERVRIERLTVALPSGRRIFHRATLTVAAGEVVVILGPSGAGKSTLGDVLFDLLADRSPGVRVTADAIDADDTRMALVLQRGALFDHLDAAGNIRFAARRRRGVRLSDDDVAALLKEVGLTVARQRVDQLSGGEERRLAVARALATAPELIFFDEPAAGLDVANVRRVGQLIRRVCQTHHAGAIVVTHNPLLAAQVGDRLLYLEQPSGTVEPLIADWSGPAAAGNEMALVAQRDAVERALLERLAGDGEASDGRAPVPSPRSPLWVGNPLAALSAPAKALMAPGRLLLVFARTLVAIPLALRQPADFARVGWRSLRLTGYSGLPFYILVAAIFSATFLSIAFAAAELVSPRLVLENLRGDFILAIAPALCGFLFAARSGSALAAWLGGLALCRQTDALKSLGVSIDEYLRAPSFVGTFFAFLLTTVVFGAAMYWAAVATAIGHGLPDAAQILRQTSPGFERDFLYKTMFYGTSVAIVCTYLGLLVKRTSADVARGITRSIIVSTLLIVVIELTFAAQL